MKTLSRDTDPEIEKLWIEGIRQRGGQASLDRCIRLSSLAWREARRAIQRSRPDLSPEQQDFLFLEVQYGAAFSQDEIEEIIRLRRERGFQSVAA